MTNDATRHQRRLFDAATFIKSAPRLADIGEDIGAEVAFAGRSNAGKSTALNALVGQKALARTSRTPGRTQMINLFGLGGETEGARRRLVDLPGYGFAKVPERVRRAWGEAMAQYFAERQSLVGVVVIMDIRHPLKALDQQMIDYAVARGLPVLALLTKADKLSFGQAKQTVARLAREHPLPDGEWMAFSGTKGTHVREVRDVISAWLDRAPD
ncbi:ribosome biogenesis GTP-binding protein YihA/YsxC [Guyparkeria hydrothermalis]|uniref:ribosome biogenesis GTP-binding protein YihA/YsxC n=1 Tax=Guyparkeria TaxID=2035712 RepID=UPI0010AD182A|nr:MULTISPECIES: ribosome biogenesis GTP-binding protein YihA/YsxC [Guyparkeria]MCL7750987.1 ribosome biogenesis GTP-binding protein YihA/YsxC [Guyparkeria hydrothermalis]TKA88897.1 YihA family ribosome biogenesis GTP-binding protein [Guyparkeria sp. SB14A]